MPPFSLRGNQSPALRVTRLGSAGEVDMREIAPTLAKMMKVSLPQADGKPLF